MTTLPKQLLEWAEKEAEKILIEDIYSGDLDRNEQAGKHFLNGVKALHAHLMEMGMAEFDELASDAHWDRYQNIWRNQPKSHLFKYGARFQHQQNAAQIQAFKQENEAIKWDRFKKFSRILADKQKRIAELEKEVERLKSAMRKAASTTALFDHAIILEEALGEEINT